MNVLHCRDSIDEPPVLLEIIAVISQEISWLALLYLPLMVIFPALEWHHPWLVPVYTA